MALIELIDTDQRKRGERREASVRNAELVSRDA
jgi:hypothetical protein